jgi:hypothetical protein
MRSGFPPGSTTTACFVSASPTMEQLQESGGTGKVFRINEGMNHSFLYSSDLPQ